MSGMNGKLNFMLKVWRQKPPAAGQFEIYAAKGISPDMSFLEMIDVVNNDLVLKGKDAIAFDHDCREGICGACSMVIDGRAHGPDGGTTTCQLFMRRFRDGSEITIEPWRARAFPVVKDLVVDRSAFDRIMQAGGYISSNTGSAPEANSVLVSKPVSETAMDAAQCIGCGACVAACKNASAMLFVSAKVSHLGLLPQGAPERESRVVAMVQKMDELGFGNCTNEGECQAVCPKEINVSNIARMNREYLRAVVKG